MDAHEMRHEVIDQVRGQVRDQALFRRNATRSAGNRLFGSVVVMTPRSGISALIIGLLAFGFVAWYVKIPQRVRAVGVLMPPDGFLDEATSHLDVDMERRVLRNIESQDITVISVTHRPDAIERADQIIRLNA